MIRNYKLKGNDIINADFGDPGLVIGSFNELLVEQEKKKIINDLIFGREMLDIYKYHRDNFHIVNVVEMLEKMEPVFRKWEQKNMEATKKAMEKETCEDLKLRFDSLEEDHEALLQDYREQREKLEKYKTWHKKALRHAQYCGDQWEYY